MQLTECEYCRCNEVLSSSEAFVYFRCGTAYWPGTSQWTYANKCVETRVKKLEERVKRAVKVLEGANQIMMTLEDDEEVSFVVESQTVSHAIEILEGEEDDDITSPESPDSSPITTDDLAASDYYEAVRQRVPWMTAVEHIEGLVEGYRQCGVTAWQTANEIERVYGGQR